MRNIAERFPDESIQVISCCIILKYLTGCLCYGNGTALHMMTVNLSQTDTLTMLIIAHQTVRVKHSRHDFFLIW